MLDLSHSRSSAGRDSRTELQLQFDGQPARHPEPEPIRMSKGTHSSGAAAHAALERRCQDCNGTLFQGEIGVCPRVDCPTAHFPTTGAALAAEQTDFAGTFIEKSKAFWPRVLPVHINSSVPAMQFRPRKRNSVGQFSLAKQIWNGPDFGRCRLSASLQ